MDIWKIKTDGKMLQKEKYKYAYKLSSIASTGLFFVKDSLSIIMAKG